MLVEELGLVEELKVEVAQVVEIEVVVVVEVYLEPDNDKAGVVVVVIVAVIPAVDIMLRELGDEVAEVQDEMVKDGGVVVVRVAVVVVTIGRLAATCAQTQNSKQLLLVQVNI